MYRLCECQQNTYRSRRSSDFEWRGLSSACKLWSAICLSALFLVSPLSAQTTYFYGFDTPELLFDPVTLQGSVDVGVVIGHEPGTTITSTEGFSLGVTIGNPVVFPTDVSPTAVANDPDFFSEVIYPDAFTVGCVISFTGGGVTLAVPEALLTVTLETEPALLAPTLVVDVPLSFDNTIGAPPVDNVIVWDGGFTSAPNLNPGILTVRSLSIPFKRGDADGNGTFAGLIDGIFILNYAFALGAEPPCFSAADADDSGTILGLVDGLFVLNYQFLGTATPPSPGPMFCGFEATPDALSCESYPCP